MKAYVFLNVLIVALAGAVFFAPGGDPPRPADLIFIAGADLRNLDPQRTTSLNDFRLLECLYEPLVRADPANNTLEPGAAESWTVSDDGRTYTFHIREDARWSNGDPVTSHDFRYGWFRASLPDFAADYVTMMFSIEGVEAFYDWRRAAVEAYTRRDAAEQSPEAAAELWRETRERFNSVPGIETPDDKTLIVHLTTPLQYFMELCAFMTFAPVHEASITPFIVGPNATTGMVEQSPHYFAPKHIVCNGPYVLKRRRPKWDILVEANPYFWNRAAMKNDSVLILIIDDPATAKMRYRIGDADWWPDVPSSSEMAADLVAQNPPDLHTYRAIGTYYISYNCTDRLPSGEDNPLADARVRRAFALAVDRQTIVKVVTGMNQPVAMCFVPENMFAGYDSPADAGAGYDPDAARALLAEAGYPGGEGLPQLSLLITDDAASRQVFEFVARTWERELGVTILFDRKVPSVFSHNRRQRNFAIARGNWFGDYNDPTTFLTMYRSDDGNNHGGWSNAEYDRLLDEADQINDAARRLALLSQAERILLEEQPLTPIYYYIELELFDDTRVKNVLRDPLRRRRIDQIEVLKRPQ